MSNPMISVAGIRGIVGDSLRIEEFFDYVLAFATLNQGGPVVLGRDSRVSGPMLNHLAIAALQSAGCDIIDIGLVPTPTVGIMVRHLGASGGIAITASHNPAEWNAYKFFGSHGSFLDDATKDRLLEIAAQGSFARKSYLQLGHHRHSNEAIGIHLKKVLDAVDTSAIVKKKFKVVVDCVNGVGQAIAEPLLQALGCHATFLHGEPTGRFPRNPEPLPENLDELGAMVKQTGAHVGFAIDPDADRLAIVDENGTPIGEERTLVLAARTVLQQGSAEPQNVVVNLSSTRALDDVSREFGCTITRTPIGEAWVVKEITDRQAVIGGEGNGGVIYPAVHPGRDAATGIGLILQGLARSGKTLSEWNGETPNYQMVKTKFPATPEAVESLRDLIAGEFNDAAELVTIDGVKAVYSDKWVHVRPSGTEPVVRIFAEGPTQAAAQELVDRAQRAFA